MVKNSKLYKKAFSPLTITMTHKKYTLGLIVAFIFLLLLQFTSAVEFSAYSTVQKIIGDSCTETQGKIIVINQEPVSQIFSISLENEDSFTYGLSREKVAILGGQSESIDLFINIPCHLNGTYDFNVIIESDTTIKTIPLVLEAKRISNVIIHNVQVQEKIKPCQVFSMSFDVYNSGSFPEKYEFSITPYSKNIGLSETSTYIMPKESKTIYAGGLLDCSIYGPVILNIRARSMNLDFTSHGNIELNVTQDYPFDLSLSTTNVCNNNVENQTLTVTNEALFNNTFNIKTNLNWVKPLTDAVIVGPESSSIINLIANPKYIENKDYELKITITSELGNIIKEIERKITVNNCYNQELFIEKEKLTLDCYQNEFEFEIKNTGEEDSLFFIESTNDNVLFDQNVLELDSEETDTVKASLLSSCLEDASDTIEIISKINNRSDLTEKLDLEVETISLLNANFIEFRVKDIKTNYAKSTKKILIQNKGIYENEYRLTLIAPDFVTLDKNSVKLKPEQVKELEFNIQPDNNTASGKYKVTIHGTLDNVNITFSESFVLNIQKEFMIDKWIHKLKLFWLYNYWIIFTLILVAIALLVLIKISLSLKQNNPLFAKLIGLILVILLVTLVVYSTILLVNSNSSTPPVNNTEDSFQTAPENEIIYTGKPLEITHLISNNYEQSIQYLIMFKVDEEINFTKTVTLSSGENLTVEIPFSTTEKFEKKNIQINTLYQVEDNLFNEKEDYVMIYQMNTWDKIKNAFSGDNNKKEVAQEEADTLKNDENETVSDLTNENAEDTSTEKNSFLLKYFPYIFVGTIGLLVLLIIFEMRKTSSKMIDKNHQLYKEMLEKEVESNPKSKKSVKNSKNKKPTKKKTPKKSISK